MSLVSRRFTIVAALLLAVRCGGGSPAQPAPPSPPPAPARAALSGVILVSGTQTPAAGARVEIVEGVNQSATATADAEGRYRLENLLHGAFTVRAQATNFEPESRAVTLSGDQTLDFALRPAAPPPGPARAVLAGTIVIAETQAPAAGARVEVVEGVNEGAAATADAAGRYRFEDLLHGSFTIRAQATGFAPETQSVTLSGDRTLDFVLRPAPPPPPSGSISGLVVDSLSNTGLAGALVRIDGLGETTTGSDGAFTLAAADPEQPRTVVITSPATVERSTRLRVPGPAATVSLIPSVFDLDAFNQMFRGSGGELHRWTTAPHLVIQRRALTFTDLSSSSYTATANLMTEEEAGALVADLEWALAQLTAGRYTQFAGVEVEAAAEGASVEVIRPGRVVVARYEGLQARENFWGYARWSWNGLGEVQSAIVKLDYAFELSGSPYRRSLRAHELGHALGYTHVTARDSVMQSHARTEPTPFDRDGARIAFQRPPRNRAPDADQDPFVGNLRALAAQLFWAGDR
jgi:hypothetical protein